VVNQQPCLEPTPWESPRPRECRSGGRRGQRRHPRSAGRSRVCEKRGAGAVATASDRSKRRLPPPPLQNFWP